MRTAGNITYRNECVSLEIYAGRRFTKSRDVPASTFFGVRVRLWALGGESKPASESGACAPVLQ